MALVGAFFYSIRAVSLASMMSTSSVGLIPESIRRISSSRTMPAGRAAERAAAERAAAEGANRLPLAPLASVGAYGVADCRQLGL